MLVNHLLNIRIRAETYPKLVRFPVSAYHLNYLDEHAWQIQNLTQQLMKYLMQSFRGKFFYFSKAFFYISKFKYIFYIQLQLQRK